MSTASRGCYSSLKTPSQPFPTCVPVRKPCKRCLMQYFRRPRCFLCRARSFSPVSERWPREPRQEQRFEHFRHTRGSHRHAHPQSTRPRSHRAAVSGIDKIFAFLLEQGVISELVTSHGLLLIALDGTWFFSSEQIMRHSCQGKRHNYLISKRDYPGDPETGSRSSGIVGGQVDYR